MLTICNHKSVPGYWCTVAVRIYPSDFNKNVVYQRYWRNRLIRYFGSNDFSFIWELAPALCIVSTDFEKIGNACTYITLLQKISLKSITTIIAHQISVIFNATFNLPLKVVTINWRSTCLKSAWSYRRPVNAHLRLWCFCSSSWWQHLIRLNLNDCTYQIKLTESSPIYQILSANLCLNCVTLDQAE